MPGLRLTSGQVQRRCGVEQTRCQLGLDSLVARKFLHVKSDGAYARTTTDALDLGVFEVLHKPFEMHDLEPLLQVACRAGGS